MAINKNFVVKNGLEVNTDLILASANTRRVGIGSTIPSTTLDVVGGIACTDINAVGVATIKTIDASTATIAHLSGTTLSVGVGTFNAIQPIHANVSGVLTAATAQFDGTATIAVGVITNLSGTNLNYTGISTFTNVTGTNLNFSGIGTFATIDSAIFTGVTTIPNADITLATIDSAQITNLNVAGVSTIADLSLDGATMDRLVVNNFTTLSGITTVANIRGTNVNVSGISTIGEFLFSGGIVTHVDGDAGIVTYYGDGSQLQFLPSASPGGSDTEVQFNAAGVFSGHPGFTYNYQTVSMPSLNVSVGGSDLQIYHSGGDGIIREDGPGSLAILSNNEVRITNVGYAQTSAVFVPTGRTEIYFNNSKKLETTANGVIVTGIVTCQDVDSLSDFNYKTNITTVDEALDKVNKLRGVKFNWKESGASAYGVIAQELESILPELVHGSEPKTVNYNGIIGVLIEAIKELKNEIDSLKNQIYNT